MKFLLDESAEYRLHPFLQKLGHDIKAIAYDYPNALTDRDMLDIAIDENRILITNDKDFGELIFRQRFYHRGIILFRLRGANVQTKQKRLQEVLTAYKDQLKHFLVITPKSVRIRKVSFTTQETVLIHSK